MSEKLVVPFPIIKTIWPPVEICRQTIAKPFSMQRRVLTLFTKDPQNDVFRRANHFLLPLLVAQLTADTIELVS